MLGALRRQSATEAVIIDVAVRDGRRRISWAYAYFEIAERGEEVELGVVRRTRFEGFLSGQATNLFAMTRFERP